MRWGEGRFAYHRGVARSADNVVGCPACGYNLIALPARGRCPECGKHYQDLKPGKAMAFWTNRRFALLLVLPPIGCALACFVLMAMIERGILVSQPGLFDLTSGANLPIVLMIVWAWQIPLILLSGAAGIIGRLRGATIIAYCFGATAFVTVTLWGVWEVCTMRDAQAPIGLIFIPFYSGIAGWLVAGLAMCLCLLGRVVWRRRSRGGGEPEPGGRV